MSFPIAPSTPAAPHRDDARAGARDAALARPLHRAAVRATGRASAARSARCPGAIR